MSQRQAGARKAIKALETDGTLKTDIVFTGDGALDAAAKEVLGAVHPISEKYNVEIGGTLVSNGNGVSYTYPIVGTERSLTLQGAGALAGFHTHPGGEINGSVFSNRFNSGVPGDVGFTQTFKIPLYMSHQPVSGGLNYSICEYNVRTCNPNFDTGALPGFNYGVEGRPVR